MNANCITGKSTVIRYRASYYLPVMQLAFILTVVDVKKIQFLIATSEWI